ncbi:MAG: hypothetical protein KAR47_15260 [Planctomycetes bacterium]|nr:hypothetical protein [Planctomycetota bacterium]
MAIEAPLGKYNKTNVKIFIVALLGLAIWFAYDGYFNQTFIDKYTDSDGAMEGTLVFNRKAPPFLIVGAVVLGAYYFAISKKKVVADDQSLITCKVTIDYDRIEAIDKTHFDSKGYFIVMYKDGQDKDCRLKLSDRTYDNLSAILDELIARIT